MRLSKRLLITLAVTVLAVAVAASSVAFTPLHTLVLSAPLRFDYVPGGGAGTKPLLTSDLDGPFIRSVSQSGQAVTFTYQASDNQPGSLQLELPDGGATLTGATYSASTETLTLTLSEGGPITADLSEVTTAVELARVAREVVEVTAAAIARAKTETLADAATAADTAIAAALAAETDAVLAGATYTADDQTLTLTLSEGDPVTADLSGVTTAAELQTAISTAIAGIDLPDAVGHGVLTGASYAAGTETLTLTLSEGDPVTADLSGVTTAAELQTAISTAIAAETDAVLTGATYTGDTETLALTLSEGGPVTADLSGLTTAAELSTAITTAIAGVTGSTITDATYASDTETLTLTLSQGGLVTADLSGLTTSAEVATAIGTALAAETDAVLTGATYTADTETLTLTLSQGGPVNADLSGLTTAAELSTAITTAIAGVTGSTVTGATYAANTETLTLTLSQGGPVEADLSGLTTSAEVATAIATALAAETDAALTGATYTANDETLTLTLSEGGPVTADLAGLTTAAELSTAISSAVATATGVPQLLGTHRRQGDSCRTFRPTSMIIPADGWILAVFTASNNSGHYVSQHSLPVSALHQLPVKIDDAATSATLRHGIANRNALTFNTRRASSGSGQAYLGLTTANRLVVGHSWRYFPCQVDIYTGPAVIGETTNTLTGAAYNSNAETLTLTLSEGGPITADLSGLTTAAELSTAITTALAAETDAVLTGATYTANDETLTLTLSEGGPVTADLSGLTTAAEVATAITTALAAETDAVLTGASYAAGAETLTLTLSEGGPITADLSGLTTAAEVATAISNAVSNRLLPDTTNAVTGQIPVVNASANGYTLSDVVTNVSPVASVNIPNNAVEAPALSVTTAGDTTVYKPPAPAFTDMGLDSRTDRARCLALRPSSIPIPADPWFFLNYTIEFTNGGTVHGPILVPSAAFADIPATLPDALPENTLQFARVLTGAERNVFAIGSLILGKTTSGNIAWGHHDSHLRDSCSIRALSLIP